MTDNFLLTADQPLICLRSCQVHPGRGKDKLDSVGLYFATYYKNALVRACHKLARIAEVCMLNLDLRNVK